MKILNTEKGLALPAGSGSPLESLGNPENSVLPSPSEPQGKFPPPVAPSDPVMTDNNHLSITPDEYNSDGRGAILWVLGSFMALIGFGLGFSYWGWM